jgi:transposase-like protein
MKFSEEEKAMWVEDWRQSGKSAWTYAKENGLVPQTFAGWTKKETAAEPCFVEVPAVITPPPRDVREVLIEKGDVKIHVPLELGRGELSAVTEWLGGVL